MSEEFKEIKKKNPDKSLGEIDTALNTWDAETCLSDLSNNDISRIMEELRNIKS